MPTWKGRSSQVSFETLASFHQSSRPDCLFTNRRSKVPQLQISCVSVTGWYGCRTTCITRPHLEPAEKKSRGGIPAALVGRLERWWAWEEWVGFERRLRLGLRISSGAGWERQVVIPGNGGWLFYFVSSLGCQAALEAQQLDHGRLLRAGWSRSGPAGLDEYLSWEGQRVRGSWAG